MILRRLSTAQVGLLSAALFTLAIIYINYRIAQLSSPSTQFSYNRGWNFKQPRVVVYNRIPKTGSTTFTNAVAYDLFKKNNFNVAHLNITKNKQVLALPDEARLVKNISEWTERHPLFIHGHMVYVDFTSFGYPAPVYINIVREPLERLLSHYYFLRYGDNYRVGLKRSRSGNNETFDDCIERRGYDCDVKQMWLQIPYFCGSHHFCSIVGNRVALEEAKRTLMEKYLLVGTTERMREMIALLDATLPDFFQGALDHFDSLDGHRSHLRNTKRKIPPLEQTLYIVRSSEVYKLEREFYDFAVEQFDAVFKKATNGSGRVADIRSAPLQYHYEKIKPAHG